MNKTIRIVVICILMLILVISVWKIYDYIKENNKNSKLNENLINKAVTVNSEDRKEEYPITVDFAELKKENNDIVAWIYSEDTPINYPVVQAQDNEFYVHRLINKNKGSQGTLFADYRNNIEKDANTIIYGHNMKNGTMFGTIKKYKNQDYYDSHKNMYYITPKKSYRVEIFTGYVTNIYSDIYDLEKLELSKINELKEKSYFKSNVEIKEEDKILTLSTCTNTSENDRYILMGVLREI